jgi:hypothetical protein
MTESGIFQSTKRIGNKMRRRIEEKDRGEGKRRRKEEKERGEGKRR